MEEVGLAEVGGRLLCELCSTDPAPGEMDRDDMVMVMGVVVDWLVVVLEQQMMVIVMVMVMRVPGGSLFQIRMLWRRTRGKLTA